MELYTTKSLSLESNSDFEDAKFAILGVPFDSTTTNKPGCRFGPYEIRKEFMEIEKYNHIAERGFYDVPFYDLGNIETIPGNLKKSLNMTEETLDRAIEKNNNIIPIGLGGEHSISYPFIKVLKQHLGELQVLHFDAHADMHDRYLGEKWSHATVMRRVGELGIKIKQVGVRCVPPEESRALNRFTINDLAPDIPTYISIDFDVFDPEFSPGVGTPEPYGMNPKEVLEIIRKTIKENNVVGFDLVEINPMVDPSNITAVLGARFLVDIATLIG